MRYARKGVAGLVEGDLLDGLLLFGRELKKTVPSAELGQLRLQGIEDAFSGADVEQQLELLDLVDREKQSFVAACRIPPPEDNIARSMIF
jgi:hypothetical protein